MSGIIHKETIAYHRPKSVRDRLVDYTISTDGYDRSGGPYIRLAAG